VSLCVDYFSHDYIKTLKCNMLFFQYTIVKIFLKVMMLQPSKSKNNLNFIGEFSMSSLNKNNLNFLPIFFSKSKGIFFVQILKKTLNFNLINFSSSLKKVFFAHSFKVHKKQKRIEFSQRLTLRLIFFFFSYTKVALPHLISNRK
jgi:hypothetical protein